MAKAVSVFGVEYATLELNCYFVVKDDGSPILAPTLYLLNRAKEGISFKSLKAYAFDLAKFFTALEYTKNITGSLGHNYADVTDIQMVAYLDGVLKKQNNLSDNTIERHKSSILGFYNFAYEYGLIKSRKKI